MLITLSLSPLSPQLIKCISTTFQMTLLSLSPLSLHVSHLFSQLHFLFFFHNDQRSKDKWIGRATRVNSCCMHVRLCSHKEKKRKYSSTLNAKKLDRLFSKNHWKRTFFNAHQTTNKRKVNRREEKGHIYQFGFRNDPWIEIGKNSTYKQINLSWLIAFHFIVRVNNQCMTD